MKYFDFDLLVERMGDKYRARVISSPAGQATIDFALPFSELELENFLLKIGRPRKGVRRIDSPEVEAVKKFGGRLFEALFDDDLRGCLRSSLDEAERQEAGLRFRLRLSEVPELCDLPWEYLYNSSLNRFLSLSIETPIVRYLDLPEGIRPLSISPPLNILVMISSPWDHAQLDVEQEWGKLKEVLVDLERQEQVMLDRLETATLSALQKKLREEKYHIFHFIGHGGFDKQAQDGTLILEDEEKRGVPVSGQFLGTLLHDHRSLRLTVLNACEGARSARADPFAGTAQSLIQQGIPAVIAMQFEVSDDAAITFAQEFYSVLADNQPVDAALGEVRKALFAKGNLVEWGTPVLYMRSPDGRIFDLKTSKKTKAAKEKKQKPQPSSSTSEATDYSHNVFISYNQDDRDWVKGELLPRLENSGLKAYVDFRDFEIGESRQANLERAINSSRRTLIVMTPAWIENDWPEMQDVLFRTTDPVGQPGKRLPLMLKKCKLPESLALLSYADFTNPDTREEEMERLLRGLGVGAARVFVSYKRGNEPDETLAKNIYRELNRKYDAFIDQTMLVGARWVERIKQELGRTDFLVVLLSAHSVHSEMVHEEIAAAHNLAQQHGGHPIILPVRVAYREPFKHPLSNYLDQINWAFWETEEDTSKIIDELKGAISGGALPIGSKESKIEVVQAEASEPMPVPLPFAQPVPIERLETPEGTMDPQSVFYIERTSDAIALQAIKRQGETITIKAPRQMGKSSLLIRIIKSAVQSGKRVAFIDFQLFEKSALSDPDIFYRQFCFWLTDKLDMDDRSDDYWKMPLGNAQRTTRYMQRYLLKELNSPLVLAMDEAESLFDTEFRSDFFSMLRNWHNSRATDPLWKQLDLALVTSTEPYQLIENLNQSPFNVGEVIELADFTPEQVAELNLRHGSPLTPAGEKEIMELLSGHPYLVRRALYLLASKRMAEAELFKNATDDRGPFGDHLRYHLFRLHGREHLIDGLQQVLRTNNCQDEKVFFRLRGAGLVRREGTAELPRCKLYADYFTEHLNG